MIYEVGTVSEIAKLQSKFPAPVLKKLHHVTATLDEVYGCDRDWKRTGGYTILAEAKEDLAAMDSICIENDIFEWEDYIPSEPPYAASLYLRGDDFSIVLIAPVSILPQNLLNELEYRKENPYAN